MLPPMKRKQGLLYLLFAVSLQKTGGPQGELPKVSLPSHSVPALICPLTLAQAFSYFAMALAASKSICDSVMVPETSTHFTSEIFFPCLLGNSSLSGCAKCRSFLQGFP